MPYKNLGMVKNATIRGALNLYNENNTLTVSVYVTEALSELRVTIESITKVCNDVTPKATCDLIFPPSSDQTVIVTDQDGIEIVSYTPVKQTEEALPEPAKPAKRPEEIKSNEVSNIFQGTVLFNEVLYLTGLHLEQYRHATVDPELYFKELLRRDPDSSRGHMAMARRLMRKSLYEEALGHAQAAVDTLTSFNPNPPSGESFFLLGLCLEYLEKFDEAVEAFGKATWNFDYKPLAHYHLARISHRLGRLDDGVRYAQLALRSHAHLHHAMHLLYVMDDSRRDILEKSLEFDPLNFMALYLRDGSEAVASSLVSFPELALAMVSELCDIGEYARALELLDLANLNLVLAASRIYVEYKLGLDITSDILESQSIEYCFPNSAFEVKVLRSVIDLNIPSGWKLSYCLGNFYYEKRVYDQALQYWEGALSGSPKSPPVLRNLAIAKYNKFQNAPDALRDLQTAFEHDQENPRLLFELDQLKKRMNIDMYERLAFFEKYAALTHTRDTTLVEYLTLLNNDGQYSKVLDILETHMFHPWEGGEGKVSGQFIMSHVQLALEDMCQGNYASALEHLEIASAPTYPENLGEGKLASMAENHLDYYKGVCHRSLGNETESIKYFKRATQGSETLGEAMFYNDSPAEIIWFQGMAYFHLGQTEKARAKFLLLKNYGKAHVNDTPTVDYFAVSLPSIDIFDSDLSRKNEVHCHYLIGLGSLGLHAMDFKSEDATMVKMERMKVRTLDSSHQGARLHLRISTCSTNGVKEEL